MTVEFEIGAVIPVSKFGNVQPKFTVTGDTLHEARDKALAEMQALFQSAGVETTFPKPEGTPAGEIVTCVASGTQVYFDEYTHTYGPGEWMSGSKFAGKFKSEFPSDIVARKMADKTTDVTAEEIQAMWAKKAEASSTYGSGIHAALELYGKYKDVSLATKGTVESALHDNPGLRPAVEQFFAGRENENALYEAFVADPVLNHCGFIDRLQILGPKRALITDFKTNTDLHKKTTILEPFKGVVPSTSLGAFWLQLSFYARIMADHGWQIDGLEVFHWTGKKWDTYSNDVLDVTIGF